MPATLHGPTPTGKSSYVPVGSGGTAVVARSRKGAVVTVVTYQCCWPSFLNTHVSSFFSGEVQHRAYTYKVRVTDPSRKVSWLKDRALKIAGKVAARAQALPK